jgi:hypothetical protein
MRTSGIAFAIIVAACTQAYATPTITISGQIDGSDAVEIDPSSATWTHTQWGSPANVVANGLAWDTVGHPTIALSGPLLPPDLANYLVTTTVVSGRDVAVARPESGHVLLQFADTPNGPDNYQVQVSFTPKPVTGPSPDATLHIGGNIDGSDVVRITASGAIWLHGQWGTPTGAFLDGMAWDTVAQPTIANSGATAFLPIGVDFSTAVLTENSGRDVSSYEAFSDHIDVVFADNQLGAGFADVTLHFGSAPEPATSALLVVASLGTMLRRRRAIKN